MKNTTIARTKDSSKYTAIEQKLAYLPNKYGSRAAPENCPDCHCDLVMEISNHELLLSCINCGYSYQSKKI